MEPIDTEVSFPYGQEFVTNWSGGFLDLEQICRICGVHSEFLLPIFDGEGLQHQLDHKINTHLHLQVLRTDALPLQLCYDCLSTIVSWHSLYLKCRETDIKFQTLFGSKDQIPAPERPIVILSSETPEHLHGVPYQQSPVKENVVSLCNLGSQEDTNINPSTPISSEAHQDSNQLSFMSYTEVLSCHSQYSLSQSRKQNAVLVTKETSNSIFDSGSLISDRTTPLLANRVSAIQPTNSNFNIPSPLENSCSRSKSVLVRNESIPPSQFPSEDLSATKHLSLGTESFMESSVIKEHCNLENVDDSSKATMVSVARPTCLRRAPTAFVVIKNIGEECSLNNENMANVPKTVSDECNVLPYNDNGFTDVPCQRFSPEDKNLNQSHVCFHCRKFIGNSVLLLAHEKSHLTDKNPPTNFICKFCLSPHNSIYSMHLHYAVHENEGERLHRGCNNRKVHLCKQCGLMCTTEERLAAHQRSHMDHTELFKHKCKTCGETFSTRSKLSVHVWSHALKPTPKTFKCHICGKGFGTKSTVMEHRLKHTSEEKSRAFRCVICGMAFGNNMLLGKHRSTHSEEELARPFKCAFCDKAFARNYTLQIHYLTHSDAKSYKCHQCGKDFKMRNSLIQHMRTHQDPSVLPSHSCHLCGKPFRTKSRLQEHIRLHSGDKPFKCTKCDKCFHKANALHTHGACHSERRPYNCDVCNKAFKWRKNLRQHRLLHSNTNEKHQNALLVKGSSTDSKKQPCDCEICGKQLSGKSGLRLHMKNFHNDGFPKQPKSTVCPVCGKELSRAGALLRHMNSTHGGVKAFKCDLCDREYSTKVARDDHRRLHTGERPYKCSVCTKTFTSLSNLHIHRLSHSENRPHKCLYCDKQFKRRAHLVPHTRIHTGEKPYICEICSRGFAQSNDLHKHRLTHSTEKSCSCSCGMAFRGKRDLARHQMKHHPSSAVQSTSQKVDIQTLRTDSVVKSLSNPHPVQHISTISYASNVNASVVVRNTGVFPTHSNQISDNLYCNDNYL